MPHILWWISIVGGLAAVFWLAYYDTSTLLFIHRLLLHADTNMSMT
jgi:hypothetical protein